MNLTFPDLNSWHDLVAMVFAAFLIGVPSWLTMRNHRAISKMDKSISNGHTNPLREDVDEIRNTLGHIREDLHYVKTELGDIRHELHEERKQRLDLEDRVERYRRRG